MKKILSVILAISLLSGIAAVSSFAESAYPESEHNYADNTDMVWNYDAGNDTKAIKVTFSDDCDLGPYLYYSERGIYDSEELTQEVVDAIEKNGYYEKGDAVYITDDYGPEKYTERTLAGETIYLFGNHFEIRLVSDSSDTFYGFKIVDIEEIKSEYVPDDEDEKTPENCGIVNYCINGEADRSEYFYDGKKITLNGDYRNFHNSSENKAIVGWKTEDGKELYYDNESYYGDTKTDIIAEAGKEYNLYPIYCKLGLTSEETFSFTNSDSVFVHEFGGYVYTKEAFRHQFIDWISTFGLSPLLPIAMIGLVFITAYWPDIDFCGSCCGFPIATILQHEGKIDLLSEQGVDKVSDLEPTDELQSAINFYNNAAIAAHVVNHWAFEPGTKEYTRQLKDLYATLENGTPVYFELYPGTQPPLKSIADHFKYHTEGTFIDSIDGAHGILLDGAFTDNEGNHILLGWDNNSELYSEGYADVFIIDKDFTSITNAGPRVIYQDEPLNGFAWNDDMSTFASFPTDGVPNPFPWHINFIEHIFELICHSITNLFN